MTQKEFFEALSKRAKKHGFMKNCLIRERETLSCPICAVANDITGREYSNKEYDKAAFDIKLDESLAESIAYAADGKDLKSRIAQKLRRAVGV